LREYGNENSNKTNVRTTQAARTSLPQAVSFGGTVMGLGVAGLAVLGLTSFFIFSSISYEWHMDFNRGHDNRLRNIGRFFLGQNQLPCLLV
jgi:Na+/H+-translocating membrane pyrophosphatase